jgi:hypothetical protein
MTVAYVGLQTDGWASAHVELGREPLGHRSGPTETSLDDALGWARSVAARVLVTAPTGLWSAGSERLPDVREWPPPDYVPSDWPTVRPPRAARWRASLQLSTIPDDPEFVAAMAEALSARLQARDGIEELIFGVPGGQLDEQTRQAEAATEEAWQRTVARLGRTARLSACSMKLHAIGEPVPSRPTIALIEGFDFSGDGSRQWTVTFNGQETAAPDAPDMTL